MDINISKNIAAELNFELQPEPKTGEPFTVYLRNVWLSSETKNGNFYLLSSAGLGGAKLFFEAKGKTYSVDMIPVFESLIKQIIK